MDTASISPNKKGRGSPCRISPNQSGYQIIAFAYSLLGAWFTATYWGDADVGFLETVMPPMHEKLVESGHTESCQQILSPFLYQSRVLYLVEGLKMPQPRI